MYDTNLALDPSFVHQLLIHFTDLRHLQISRGERGKGKAEFIALDQNTAHGFLLVTLCDFAPMEERHASQL